LCKRRDIGQGERLGAHRADIRAFALLRPQDFDHFKVEYVPETLGKEGKFAVYQNVHIIRRHREQSVDGVASDSTHPPTIHQCEFASRILHYFSAQNR